MSDERCARHGFVLIQPVAYVEHVPAAGQQAYCARCRDEEMARERVRRDAEMACVALVRRLAQMGTLAWGGRTQLHPWIEEARVLVTRLDGGNDGQ